MTEALRSRVMFERRLSMLSVVALLSVGSALQAQEPVVGMKDPESLFGIRSRRSDRNKQAALHIMRELLQCGQWDRAGEWLTQAYHQHNPNAASGRDGVVTFFTKVLKVARVDTCDTLTTPVVAVTPATPTSTVVTPVKRPERGRPARSTADVVRHWHFVDGKVRQQWDPARLPRQRHADAALRADGLFSGPP